MFWFLLALLFGIFGVVFFQMGIAKGEKEGNWEKGWLGFGACLIVVAALFLAVSVIYTMDQYGGQKYDIASLKMYDNKTALYKQRMDSLTAQFAHYLAEVYPRHERDVFKGLSPDKVSLYLAKYPDLKASATVVALVEQIEKLNTDYYGQQLEKEGVLRAMRFRRLNPWSFSFLMPDIPKSE